MYNSKIFVCKIPNDISFETEDLLVSKVSSDRKVKYKKLKNHIQQLQCIVSYLLLKYLLVKYFNYPKAKDIVFRFEKGSSKPKINYLNLYFNISHSNNAVLVAVSREEIGVDIEKKDQKLEFLVQYFHFKEQLICFNNMEETIKIWTLKESYAKLSGIGINDELLKRRLYYQKDHQNLYGVLFSSIEIKDYIISICSNQYYFESDIQNITIGEILDVL